MRGRARGSAVFGPTLRTGDDTMMHGFDGMGWGMGWAMGLLWVLALAVLLLSVAALIKYLRR